jgi:Na+/H+-dicarboxylate symporter
LLNQNRVYFSNFTLKIIQLMKTKTSLLILLTALAASIGVPSDPGTGIIILSAILIAAGIPPVAIVLLLGVDRILDMTRTMVNVTGDLTACLFFDKKIKADEKYDESKN